MSSLKRLTSGLLFFGFALLGLARCADTLLTKPDKSLGAIVVDLYNVRFGSFLKLCAWTTRKNVISEGFAALG